MKPGLHKRLPVDSVVLDKENPRIKNWLEMYVGSPTPEQIEQALGAGVGEIEQEGAPSFHRLRESILTNRGIIQPIIVNTLADGTLLCVEGNTRVCIYRNFLERGIEGEWDEIPAIVYEQLNEEEIDAIRLQAHLVGPRPWDAYSKAKYLAFLRDKQHFTFAKLIQYCGGSKRAVQESIDAFNDMEVYYRPVCSADGDFDPRRFSGFVELQRKNVKTVLFEEGYDVSDFAKWIYEGKFQRLETVRDLPQILKNAKAKEVFFKKGAAEAVKFLDRPELDKALLEATIPQLAQALAEAINKMTVVELDNFKAQPDSNACYYIREAHDALDTLVKRLDDRE